MCDTLRQLLGSAWLLILWVGMGAVVRGFADFITAFRVRSLSQGA